jgi:ABC-type transporter Mla subunit MlaD
MDPEIKAMFAGLIEAQSRTDRNINQFAATFARGQEELQAVFKRSNEELTAAHKRTEAAIEELAASASRYITSSDERMKRLEANLDGLIEAITREHSNGKKRGGE